MRNSRFKLKQSALLAASVSLIFIDSSAWANPTGPQVVNGAVAFQRPNASTLNVTNSPGSIINWQGFSIGASELTRFIQQSSSSAVLNRVVGADISQIQGQLLSNGRVFLINPAGIVIGPGAVVDTAGFVGSTLNMLDADFLAGKLKFQGDAASGSIINQGWIRTGYGGKVILVAPQIENSGLIHTPGGELILAAGQKLTITSLDLEGVQFEVQAPTDSVVNLGKLLADGGAVGVFAGTLRHSGEIRANALVYDEAGRVVLKAQNEIQIAAGSTTSADGKTGGNVTVQADQGLNRIAGQVTATGSAGRGGDIQLLGNRVAVVENAVVDASGSAGGGQILVGGDYQGSNASIQNSINTFVRSGATLRADATQAGDGGRIIVWSDDKTQFYGNLGAQGGPDGGNGGFAEVSGKQDLIFAGGANLGAPQGSLGTLLLDPLDLFVFSGGGVNPFIIDESTDFPSNAATVSPATLAAITGNVSLFASRYMRISDPISLTTSGQSLTAQVGTYTVPALPDPLALSTGTVLNRLELGANISTTGGAVSLSAPELQSFNLPTISTAGGAISLSATGAIFFSSTSLNAGSGTVTANSGSALRLNAITGGSFTATAPSFITTGTITTSGGPVSLTSTGSSVSASGGITTAGGNASVSGTSVSVSGGITTGGGSVALTGTSFSANNFGTISAGSGSVSLSGSSISGGTIDTTGNVTLTASAGSIFATVNNSSSLTATATSSSSVFVSIGSATDLNANSVSATTTGCFSFFGCQSGSVSLSATGNVNVGTATATAPVSGNNSISESVSISSSTGSIRAMTASSQITAADVSLLTGLGTGGGIGTAATALKADVERNFTFRPNGEFNAVLNGTGPSGLTAQVGVAPAALSYSGTLSRSGGGLTLNASATDTTVTVSNLAVTSGFNQRVFNSTPFITLRVPNGALVASSVTVPEGDTNPTTISPPFTTATLPVSISSSGNLTVNSYTRQSSASSLAKTTSFQSDTGTVTLGTINASKDSVTVNAFGSGGNISVSNLSTAGNVSITSSLGDVTVDRIDTTSGTGSVSLNASFGAVKAQTDSVATEITSGSTIAITGQTIGASTFTNPLDMAGSAVTLTSQSSGGQIGFAGAPVVANTQTLTINAASPTAFNVNTGAKFNVSTGATALKNLTVTANPAAVGMGGLAQVRTEAGGANDKTYSFVSTGTDFSFNPGAIPASQFAGGILSFTSTNGNVSLGNINMGTGGLSVAAPNGSITGGANLDGSSLTLSAGTGVSGSAVNITTGNIGANVRPSNLQITSGNNGFFTSRSGSVTTGTIEAGTIGINSFNGNITIGSVGTTTRAGAVTLSSNNKNFADAGTILTGNIRADSIDVSSGAFATNGSITTGSLEATSSVNVRSDSSITTGTLDSPVINISSNPGCCSPAPAISVGTIGGTTPVKTLTISGSTAAIGGAVTGDPAQTDTINISASSGALTLTGGTITAGNGSTVNLFSNGLTPFQFSTINAAATGAVSITSANGIQQTVDSAGSGITAKTVTLSATGSSAPISNTADTAFSRLDLNGTTNLTVDAGGTARFDAHNSQFTDLTITKRQIPDVAAFELANMGSAGTGGVQTLNISAGTSGFDLLLNSPTALNFNLNHTAGGITLVGGGIVTSGGNAALAASGAIDASTGGITTGGATGGGAVNISASGGSVTTGTISTIPTGTGTGGAISVNTNCASCNIVVSGNLNAGTGATAGAISLSAIDGSVTRSGAFQISSGSSVSVFASNGDIGTSGSPLLISAPTVNLDSRLVLPTTGGEGRAFASLTGTASLALRGEDGFNVSSDTALTTLTLETKGTGAGIPANSTLNLSAPGQTFSFARPATDLFGAGITTTFQVVSAGGTPVANATFRALDGDLLIGGPGTINSTSLTLNAQSGTGNLKLQGTAANPLSLSNTTQNFSAGQDFLITGNVTLAASGSQTLSAFRNITARAQSGSIALSAANQTIQSTSGTISFTGGAAADEKITVSASNTQTIQTFQFSGGQDITLQAGAGDRASATVSYTGTGEQLIQANNNVLILGGGGTSTDSIVEITTATGSQLIRAEGNINLTGGAGTNAIARIRNTGTGNQQVGESRAGFFFTSFPYQTNNITLQAGNGSGSTAEISAAGPQQILVNGGTLGVLGGSGANAFARIESSSASEQQIGFPQYFPFCCGFTMGSLNIQGGAGTGSYARITNLNGFQRVTATSSIILTGNAADASASLIGAGQDIRFGNTTLTAGTGNNANALIQSTSTQFIDPGNLTLQGGGGASATAQILAAGTQTISNANAISLTGGAGSDSIAKISTTADNQFISFGSLALTGGLGTGSFAKVAMTGTTNPLQRLSGGAVTLTAGDVANTGAIIEGNHQEINIGSLSLTGGIGTSVSPSDAVIRNTSLHQEISVSGNITLTCGEDFSTTGILNLGSEHQTVIATGNISLISTLGTTATAPVLIQNSPVTSQTISAGGGLSLNTPSAGAVEITSQGTQTITARFVDVLTSAGSSGNAKISSEGAQRIHTTDGTLSPTGSMRVASLGTGTAIIGSGASQLLELDYPEQMQFARDGKLTVGNVNAVGASLILAVDQSVFARSIVIEGGSGAGSLSKLGATNTQTITTLQGGIQVLGGSGTNSLATIDPVTQTILSNGTVALLGGSGGNADASIVSAGPQTILTTNGDITLTGGTGVGADAFMTSGFPQSISAAGNTILTPVVGNAFISSAPPPSTGGSSVTVENTITSQTVTEQGNQNTVLTNVTAPTGDTEPTGRAPICR